MKLSKNKLYKLKHQKNSSRKKIVFRKKAKSSHENSKKKNKKIKNLRKKTLKRYKGGDVSVVDTTENTIPIEEMSNPKYNTGIESMSESATNEQSSEETLNSVPKTDIVNTTSDGATSTTTTTTNSTISNPINLTKLAHREVLDPNSVPQANVDDIEADTNTNDENGYNTDNVPDTNTNDETGSKSTPFTTEQLETIYDSYRLKYVLDDSGNEIEKQVPFTKKSLIRLLTSTNEDGAKIRELFGFPANMKKSQLNTGSEFNKIFANILTTIGIDTLDENTSAPLSDENNISFVEFKKFVECGTYRDKNTTDTFNCINIKPPDPTNGDPTNEDSTNSDPTDNDPTDNDPTNSESTDNESTDSNIAIASPVLESPQNIELEINEQPFNTTIKRVDISIFVPNNSEVIVRDYAKNSVQETLTGLGTYSSSDLV